MFCGRKLGDTRRKLVESSSDNRFCEQFATNKNLLISYENRPAHVRSWQHLARSRNFLLRRGTTVSLSNMKIVALM